MTRLLFIIFLCVLFCSCGINTDKNNLSSSGTFSSQDDIEDSIKTMLLGKWKRTDFFVEKIGELKHFDQLKNNYYFLFKDQGVLIERSSLSDDTLNWSLEMNPLKVILTVDEEKMNLNFSNTLFIEEINDTSLHVFSEESNNSKDGEDQKIKFHMKFIRIPN
ncbi:hypothetical protein [Brumimicrobium mesophilum]|uniref:hypothetical protein n=1 Tax=Brumimicrobium mesophilum TaxID=392717 RepID=UPI000D13F108|nr:hypothetical protein [Brumimicrobium mesophilum]